MIVALLAFQAGTAATLPTEPVALKIMRETTQIGNARVMHKLLPDGGKQVDTFVGLDARGGGQVQIRLSMKYGPDGSAVFGSRAMTDPKGAVIDNLVAQFTKDAVTLTRIDGENRRSVVVDAPKGVSLANPSVFWFIKNAPKAEEKFTFATFDLERGTWATVSGAYLGKTEVPGKPGTTAHRMNIGGSESWVDDKGLPIRIELAGGVRMER